MPARQSRTVFAEHGNDPDANQLVGIGMPRNRHARCGRTRFGKISGKFECGGFEIINAFATALPAIGFDHVVEIGTEMI